MPFRKNVFILGAGFSAGAGVPVMGNFLETSKRLMEDPSSGLPPPHKGAFEGVFAFLHRLRVAQAKTTLDIENIEHLFGLAEIFTEFGEEEADGLRRNLIALILQTIERSIETERLQKGAWSVTTREPDGLHARGVEANYGELFAALASRRWCAGTDGIPSNGICRDTIITMNYDCFLDDALIRLGVAPDYRLHNAGYPDYFKKQTFHISLLKLHGSANWFHCPTYMEQGCSHRASQ